MTSTQIFPRFTSVATVVSVALSVSLLTFSQARGDEKNDLTPALKAVQGGWSSHQDAQIQAKWTIQDRSFKAVVYGVEYKGDLTVAEDAKPHPAFTVEITHGPGDVVGKSAKGVYSLEGDSLTVNLAIPGKNRPVDFEPDGVENFLFELTRDGSSSK